MQFRAVLTWLTLSLLAMLGAASRTAQAAPEGETAQTQPTAPASTALLDRPIVSIRSELLGDSFRDTALPTLTIPQDATYSNEFARSTLRAAMATGRFATGDVSAEVEGSGVRLTLRLTPRRVIQDVVLSAQDAELQRDEFLREVEVARDQEIVGAAIPALSERVKLAMQRRGYPNASVRVQLDKGSDGTHVVLRLLIAPGTAALIGRRAFDTSDDLGRDASILESYAAKVGDRVDESRLLVADTELQVKLRSLGFFEAEVSHAIDVERVLTTLRVKSMLGVRTRTVFIGAQSYDQEALRGAVGTDSDSDRTPGHLQEKLRAFYHKRGFLDVEVSVEEQSSKRGRALLFRIRENLRVRVKERQYPCFRAAEFENQTTQVAPRSDAAIGREIDSFLEEELPGGELLRTPRPTEFADALDNQVSRGSRPVPLELNPSTTFVPAVYEKAAQHLQDLYRADGYLSALVGPVRVIRKTCSKRSPPGACIPLEAAAEPGEACLADTRGLPVASSAADTSAVCVPDPARGIVCAPEVSLRIPVRLGPRTILSDAMFQGVRAESPQVLLKESGLEFGKPASQLRLEDARRALTQYYQELGYAYAQVRINLERSYDQSHARVVFDIVEGEQVRIRTIVLRGNTNTLDSIIRRRLAFAEGDIYRTSGARKSQERIATLGTFSSVNIALDDPFVPERWKTVVVTLTEPVPGSINGELGVSSGEGIRVSAELGYRNILGRAINTTLSAQASYLPTAFVLDTGLQKNFSALSTGARIPVRIVGSAQFPEIGLGPLVRGAFDPFFVHDLQRDYYIRKGAAVPSIVFSPMRELRITVSQSVEWNSVRIFQQDQGQSLEEYQRQLVLAGARDRLNALLVPQGESVVSAQKLAFVWDRRDNALDATRGTLVGLSIEHVDAYSLNAPVAGTIDRDSHFLRFTETLAAYLPLYGRLRIGAQVRGGLNVQLTNTSVTYTDRLFFLGGSDSMRAWFPSTFIPQDDADLIEADQDKTVRVPTYGGATNIPDPTRYTARTRPVRGGNLMVNPRVELRIPVFSFFETALFADFGNLWTDARYPFRAGAGFPPFRVALGTGLRIQTPVFPIVVDVGFNPWRRTYDDRPLAFNFSIGLF